MKRKQLIKRIRNIPENVIVGRLECNGRHLSDYFLVGEDGNYAQGTWGPDGKPQIPLMCSEDEIGDFAVEQFLLRHVPIFKTEEEVPDRVTASLNFASEEPPKLEPLPQFSAGISGGWEDAFYDEQP